MNERKNPKTFGEAEYQISADYRSHFKEMRDSSVATSPAQRCLFPKVHGCTQVRAPTDGIALG